MPELASAPVLLVYPPCGALSFPSLGLSILKSALEFNGIKCDIRYLNFDFLDLLPGNAVDRLRLYDMISQRNDWCVGDWLFSNEIASLVDTEAEFRLFLESEGAGPRFIQKCMAARATAQEFVRQIIKDLPWSRYKIVGFHSIFNQTLACLSIAKRLKEVYPGIITLFGGPGAQGDLGVEIVRQFPQIDYAVRGEADRIIVPIVRAILAGDRPLSLPGVVHRASTGTVTANPIEIVTDMDTVPLPDFEDYFGRFHRSGYENFIEVFLPIENTRGCWWGAKHHCTFCGIDDTAMAFRKKSAHRVLNDMKELVERYGVRAFRCVDNILDLTYFDTVLPYLSEQQPGLRVFHEIKANVKRKQIKLLARAGVTLLQPGLRTPIV